MIGQSPQNAPPDDAIGTPDAAGSPPGGVQPTATDDGSTPAPPKEWGGREGPEPTRYGDWEKNGRCIDF
jgi:hypothetical protein